MVIAKFRSQLSVVSERTSIYLEKLQIVLNRLLKVAAAELKEVGRHSVIVFRKLRVSSRHALRAANERAGRLRVEVSSVSKKAKAQAQAAQEAASVLGKIGVDKVQRLRQESESELRRAAAGCQAAIAATGGKIAGLGTQASVRSKHAARKLVGLARTIADKPRRIREARTAKEDDLRNLMASPLEAMILTDRDRRLIAANTKALELFGISEFNFGNFTLDTFVPNFDWRASSFEGNRPNRCKIRRLDGGLRVAEYEVVAGIVPRRSLYRFRSVTPYKIALPRCSKEVGSRALPDPAPKATLPVAQTSRHDVPPVL